MIKLNRYFIPYIVLLFILGFKGETILGIGIVFFHECTHYVTARILGFKGFDVEILPIGAVLKLKDLDEATPLEDFIISVSGPLFNLVMALVFYRLNLNLMFIGNLSIGVINLIPAFPLDGGRLLRDIFLIKTIYKKANVFVIYISFFIGYILLFCSLVLAYSGNFNINLSLIAFFIIYCASKERERVVFVIMGDIIRKRDKIIKRGYMENKWVSIFYKKSLLYALSLVEKGRYNIFTILNEDIEVVYTIYEQEIVEGLKKYGNITLEEFIEL